MRGVLTLAIELWTFGSPGRLLSPHFESVNLILTLSQSRVATHQVGWSTFIYTQLWIFLSNKICFTMFYKHCGHGWTILMRPLLGAHKVLGLHSPVACGSLPKIHVHLVAPLLYSLTCEQVSMNISSMLHVGSCKTLQLFLLACPHNANWPLQCSCLVQNYSYLAWICMQHHYHTWHVLALSQHQPCSGFHMLTYCCMYRPMLMVGENKPPRQGLLPLHLPFVS